MNQSKLSSFVFGIAVGLLGQAGDDLFEIAGDVADGDVLFGQLTLEPRHLFGEPLGHRADGFVLRLFDQLALTCDYGLDRAEELRFLLLVERQPLPHPRSQIGRAARRGCGGRRLTIVRWEKLGHSHLTLALHQGMCRRTSHSTVTPELCPRATNRLENRSNATLGTLDPSRSDDSVSGFRRRPRRKFDTAFPKMPDGRQSRAGRSLTTTTVTSSRLRLKSR